MDVRTFGRGLKEKMREFGFEAEYTEANLDGFTDSSGVLFDPEKYSFKEARDYLIRNVLK